MIRKSLKVVETLQVVPRSNSFTSNCMVVQSKLECFSGIVELTSMMLGSASASKQNMLIVESFWVPMVCHRWFWKVDNRWHRQCQSVDTLAELSEVWTVRDFIRVTPILMLPSPSMKFRNSLLIYFPLMVSWFLLSLEELIRRLNYKNSLKENGNKRLCTPTIYY